jgi:CrcB protein
MNALAQVMLVGVAGFAGAIARFGIASLVARLGWNFPLGTLLINVVGSFALGLLIGWGAAKGTLPEHLRLAVGVGFLGAFTTFSAFAVETDALFRTGHNMGQLGTCC